MGIGTLGFIKGFTSTQLSSIEKREEFQREKDKAEMLEKLRREGERIAAQRNFDNEDQKVNDNLTHYDYDNGTITFFNGKGRALSTKVMTEAEKKEYKDKQTATGLAIEGKRLDNNLTAERARTERAQQANLYDNIKKRGSASASSGDGSTSGSAFTTEAPMLFLDKTASELMNIDPGIQARIDQYAIPVATLEAIKRDAISQAMRSTSAKTQAARAQLASTIMRQAIDAVGKNYPKTEDSLQFVTK